MPTGIEWADETWNPVSGCTRVSSGCDNCYAAKMSYRLERMGQAKYAGLTSVNRRCDRHFNGIVRCHEEELLKPLSWKKPRRIFVNSMADSFHRDVPFAFIDRMFAVGAHCPQHQFLFLTKRPERLAEYFAADGVRDRITSAYFDLDPNSGWVATPSMADCGDDGDFELPWPLPNVWLGTSCEDQKTADERIPCLLKCPAVVRFMSCEPLLGPIDLTPFFWGRTSECPECPKDADCPCGWRTVKENGSPHVSWVIIGGESSPNARTMKVEWARGIVGQCRDAGVPVFFKQMGKSPSDFMLPVETRDPKGHDWVGYDDLRVRESPA
jgi:protein gp37